MFYCLGAAAAHPRGEHGGAVAARGGRHAVPLVPHGAAAHQEEGALSALRPHLLLVVRVARGAVRPAPRPRARLLRVPHAAAARHRALLQHRPAHLAPLTLHYS